MKEEEPESDERAAAGRSRLLRSRSEFHLALLWSFFGLAAILFWGGFGLQPWQCLVGVGLLAALVHRSLWVGIFSFLGVALLWTAVVLILVLLWGSSALGAFLG